jgi:hypothetical protein
MTATPLASLLKAEGSKIKGKSGRLKAFIGYSVIALFGNQKP